MFFLYNVKFYFLLFSKGNCQHKGEVHGPRRQQRESRHRPLGHGLHSWTGWKKLACFEKKCFISIQWNNLFLCIHSWTGWKKLACFDTKMFYFNSIEQPILMHSFVDRLKKASLFWQKNVLFQFNETTYSYAFIRGQVDKSLLV